MFKENFNFFIPVDIVKGKTKDKDGNEEMYIKGIASTPDKDLDEEFLDPAGFDLSYFLKAGIINYNHKANVDPKFIIGEPTVAKVTKEGLYMEGRLYNNDLAKETYNKTKELQEQSDTRRMGFSIEGKAIERDPLNQKRVTKAIITGVAMTISPKNNKTYAEILQKGIDDLDFSHEECDDEDELMKKKAMEAGSETGRDVTNQPSSGAALKKEDLDKDLKNQEFGEKITKAQALEKILLSKAGISIADAEKIYDYITKSLNMAKGKNFVEDKVDSTDVEKALQLLSKAQDIINKSDDGGEDEDGDDDDSEDMEKAVEFITTSLNEKLSKAKIYSELIKKGYDKELADTAYATVKENIEKSVKEAEEAAVKADLKKSFEAKKAELETLRAELIEKGFTSEELGEVSTIQKSAENTLVVSTEAIKFDDSVLRKGIEDLQEMLIDKNFNIGVILKGIYETVEEIKANNANLAKSVEDVISTVGDLSKSLDEAPGRKSVATVKPVERFEKSVEPNQQRQNVLSLRHPVQRKKVLDMLESAAFSKGYDAEFGNLIVQIESNGTLDQNAVERFRIEKGFEISVL